MRIFLSDSQPVIDAGNKYFSIVGPLLIIWAIISNLFGRQIANKFVENDTFSEKRIKLRPYFYGKSSAGIVTIGSGVILCICYGDIAQALLFFFVLMGYCLIFIVYPWRVRLRYTNRHLYYREWMQEIKIPMSEISCIALEGNRSHSHGHTLVIYLYTGKKISLHTSEYIGLNQLRKTFDSFQKVKSENT